MHLDLSGASLAELGLVFVVACVGKLVGTGVGAHLGGIPRCEASILVVLVNTRGLVELVVLQVGLTAGILDPELFSAFVVMALATTLLTGPLISLVRRHAPAAPRAIGQRQFRKGRPDVRHPV